MEKINKAQLIALNTLVSKLKISKQHKADMVEGFSGGRETSSAELFVPEAAAMISHLKSLDPEEAAADKMRKKIISLAHEMNWRIPGTTRADMKRIDRWCRTFGYKKKSLDNYTYRELPTLVTQFEAVHKSYLKAF